MAILSNSKRSLFQATYSAVDPSLRPEAPVNNLPFGRSRAWDKRAFASAMSMSSEDIVILSSEVARNANNAEDTQKIQHCLSVLKTFATKAEERIGVDSAAMFRDISPKTLLKVSSLFIKMQQAKIARLLNAHLEINQAFGKVESELAISTGPAPTLSPVWRRVADEDTAFRLPRPVYRYEREDHVAPPTERSTQPSSRVSREAGEYSHKVTKVIFGVKDNLTGSAMQPTLSSAEGVSLLSIMRWAQTKDIHADEAKETIRLAKLIKVDEKKHGMQHFKIIAETYLESLFNIAKGFAQNHQVEPVGYLHLERISFLPAGIERGELVYSLPMAPLEEVRLSHKEWADTSEEFERIVQDYEEDYSEEGVSEKSELAQSTRSEMEHSSAFNTGVTASGRFGPVNISATVGYDLETSASRSEEFSRNQTIEITRKASSRAKKEHKISFKVTTRSGTEDNTARTISNPFADKTVRYDYYQLMRKWQVNLHRYGVRLTYDINIPEPGLDILSKIQEIKDIKATLQQGFGAADAVSTWARFDLQPTDITRENYTAYEADYCTLVEPPPQQFKWYEASAVHHWTDPDDAKYSQYYLLETDVDQEYEVTEVTTDHADRTWEDEDHSTWYEDRLENYLGRSGKMTWAYRARYLVALYVEWRMTAELRHDIFVKWQSKAWNTLRDAAHSRYLEQRQYLQNRLTDLLNEIGGQDALSLRKIEREEIMKGVLRWMFGPDFDFVPPGVPENLYAADGSVRSDAVWGKVLSQSELIKFLHQAIEWENMIYLLYPYFWSHSSRWQFKKYLDHPDYLHRTFLKAGSARVVLTIRPGFEKDFVSLMENGNFERLPDNHPYITIAEELENYAQTNYPGIPPANPEEAAINEEGKLIGTWFEYSPTSALDIEMSFELPDA